ncbi:uncharacterized protein LOC128081284 isoform X33 [Tympanuchus pallidicinctus]|uniref:uncharacterized protein LOC128081284 isoform X33 n=1 Tax=Tympanuchus pallidicinctus TaxID=109042 RepID=UPI00228739DB|nr:uncharacterized protein LOC128081284 isoform X33 [Tympanuchus pallidicinctus]
MKGVGLERSLQITEPWDGWDGRVLTDHRAMGWLGWKGPYRSQSHGMVGMEGSLQITEPWDGWDGRSLQITEPWDGWDGRVLTDHRAMGWLGWKVLTDHRAMGWLGWKVLTDHRAVGWLGWKGPYRSQSRGMVGLERSLQITEPWDGWDGRVLTDHRAMGWLGWKGPYRSQSHGMVGMEGSLQITEPWDGWDGRSLQITEPWDGWDGRVLTDHRAMGWLGWKVLADQPFPLAPSLCPIRYLSPPSARAPFKPPRSPLPKLRSELRAVGLRPLSSRAAPCPRNSLWVGLSPSQRCSLPSLIPDCLGN